MLWRHKNGDESRIEAGIERDEGAPIFEVKREGDDIQRSVTISVSLEIILGVAVAACLLLWALLR